MRPYWKLVFSITAFVFSSGAAFADVDVADMEPEETLTIGRATRDVVLEEHRWQGLLAQLNGEQSRRSLPPIDLRIISSSAGLLWDLWDNKMDVFVGDPFVAAGLIHEIAANPIFVIDEREPSSQRAVIIVRETENIDRSVDLHGRHLAFPRHGSSLVHLLPHSMLLRHGLTVVEIERDQEVPPDRIGAFYLHDDLSPLMWLYRSSLGAKAAVVSMPDFQKVERRRPDLFHPIMFSSPIPIMVAVTSARVDPATRKSLIERFEEARHDLFEALGIARNGRTRFRPVTIDDPVIIDLLSRLSAVETAAEIP